LRKAANASANLLVGAIKFIIVGIYRVFFGWWLGGIQERSIVRRLKGRARREFGFLFKYEGAQFVPNDAIYEAGHVVTVAADEVLLRIAHHHGEDFVDIAPRHAAREWEPISFALMALDAKQPILKVEDVPAYVSFLSLSELASLLESRFKELKKAHSPSDYPLTRQILNTIRSFSRYSRTGVLFRRSNMGSATGPPYSSKI
jgi:hypothetical protein